MRPTEYIISAGRVCAWLAGLVVAHLGWKDYKTSVKADLLARLLLLASAARLSLSGACAARRRPGGRRGPCAESVRQALLANLPRSRRALEEGLVEALHQSLPGGIAGRPVMALDYHERPCYAKKRKHLARPGPKKQGTRRFWCYATLSAFWQGRRFTVGLVSVRRTSRLTTVVGRLLTQAAAAGLRPGLLLLDRAFYAAEVIAELQRRGLAFVMPMTRKGKEGTEGGNRRFFAASHPTGWHDYRWEAPLRRLDERRQKRVKRGKLAVEVEVCVARHPKKGEPLVFACWGVRGVPPEVVVQWYRRRFGIESSYRLLGQCLAPTCTTHEGARLLYVGIALLIGNGWALLRHHDLLDEEAGRATGRAHRLPLPTLRLHLAVYLADRLGIVLDKTTYSASLDTTLPQNDPYDYSG